MENSLSNCNKKQYIYHVKLDQSGPSPCSQAAGGLAANGISPINWLTYGI